MCCHSSSQRGFVREKIGRIQQRYIGGPMKITISKISQLTLLLSTLAWTSWATAQELTHNSEVKMAKISHSNELEITSCAMEGEACWNASCCTGLVCTGGEWTRSCRELKACQSDSDCESWQYCFAVGGGVSKYCIP